GVVENVTKQRALPPSFRLPCFLAGLFLPSAAPLSRCCLPSKVTYGKHYPTGCSLSRTFGISLRDGDYPGNVLNGIASPYRLRVRQSFAGCLMDDFQFLPRSIPVCKALEEFNRIPT